MPTPPSVHSGKVLVLKCECVRAGADEDVEAVMTRLAAQSAENAALKERQAKLDKDQQVSVLHLVVCQQWQCQRH